MGTLWGYIICGTPRTGSTFLCHLLASTGVLGHPESYFREPDEATWARRFDLRVEGQRVHDYHLFARAVRDSATTPNGVFGARIMWGSIPRIRQGLDPEDDQSDLAALQDAFGPLRFVHLQRRDTVGQAVSWARAEQTGYWQQGDSVHTNPKPDVAQMVQIVRTIKAHNAAWRSWFDRHGIEPYELDYAELTTKPSMVLGEIAALVGLSRVPSWRRDDLSQRQADLISEEWSALLRAALAQSED